MAYNLLCEISSRPDWNKINSIIKKYDKLEFFPIILPDKECLAVSVSMKNLGNKTYQQFVSIYKILSKKFGFEIYDMYYGKPVNKEQLKNIKNKII